MGNKFQVDDWIVTLDQNGTTKFGKYKRVWEGRSLIKAIYHAWMAKGYSGCVKIEWRRTR